MKTSTCTLLLALAASTSALATELDDRWYVDIGGGVILPDNDLRPDDAHVAMLRVGRHFSDQYAFEVEAFKDEFDFGIDFPLEHEGVNFNFMVVNRVPLWNPYFLIGIGAIRTMGEGIPGETSAAVNVGIGGRWVLSEGGIMLRADARLRYDDNNSQVPGNEGYGDGVVTVSISFPLGRRGR